MGKIYLTALAFLASLTLSNATTTINYGDDLTAYFNALGESHSYNFDATAGDKILLRMRGTSSGVDACMELFDPSGNSIGEACDDGGIVFLDGLLLESTGTFTIATHDHDDNDTGEYGLSLTLLNNPQINEAVLCTTDLIANLSHQTQVDAYAYTGEAGDLMVLQMRGVQGNIESQLRIYDPSGNLLAEALPSGGLSKIDAFVLPETGTYTVLCMDKNGNDLGDYGFSIQWINTSNCAVPLECGVGQTATLDYIVEMHAYSIEVNTDDRIYVRMRGEQGVEAELQLYDPNGNLVASDAPSSGMAEIENYLATAAGTYFVMARDGAGNDTGSYGIVYRNLGDEGCSPLMDCDLDLTTSIDHLADLDVYRFEGLAGDKFWLQARSPNSSVELQMEWYDENGVQLDIDISGGGQISLEGIELSADGTYFAFLSDKSGNDLGEYGFSFQKMSNANCAIVLECGEANITNTFNSLSEIQSYTISGVAGDVVTISMIEEDASLEPVLCICTPDGNIIVDSTASHDITIHDLVLPQTGNYLLLAMDRHGNDMGAYTLSVSSDCPVIPDTTPPTIAGCSDVTITADELNAGTNADFYENWISQVTATDAEGATTITNNFDPNGFSCLSGISGTQVVLFTATDENNNTNTCKATITVTDNALPVPTINTLPDLSADCEITVEIPTATNPCDGELIYGVTYDEMTFNTIGTYTINWIYININGEATYQEQSVTVTNSVGVVVSATILPTLSADCEIEIEAPTGTDGCSGDIIFGHTTSPMYYDEQGTYTILWSYGSLLAGNLTTQLQTVIIEDTTPPVTTCEDKILTLDATGSVSVDLVNLAGATDNCGVMLSSAQPLQFTCADVGAHELEFSLTDIYGNETICNMTLTIEGSVACEEEEAFVCGDLPDNYSQTAVRDDEGEACYDFGNDLYQVKALGGDIYGTADEFYFVSTEMNGSYYMKTKMMEMTSTDTYAAGGLMIRKKTNKEGSKNASLLVTTAGKLLLQVREKDDKYTAVTDLGDVTLPIWLKLEYEKSDKQVLAYTSENGANWDQVGAASVNLNGKCYAGIATSSYNDTEENIAYYQYTQAGYVSSFTGGSNLHPSTDFTILECKDEYEDRADSGNCNTPTVAKSTKKKAKTIACYPNPAVEQVSVDLEDFETEDVEVMLLSLTGQVVWHIEKKVALGEHLTINLLDLQLEQGYYRMSVRNGKKIISKPIYIVRPED